MRHARSTSRLAALLVPCLALACVVRAQDQQQLFERQGEYVGELTVPGADAATRFGAQLIARSSEDGGDPRLVLVLHTGGLPGAGWRRGDPRQGCEAAFERGGAATFALDGMRAALSENGLRFTDSDGGALGQLVRIERESPTLGAPPPTGAVVLFDGTSAEAFEGGRTERQKSNGDTVLQVGCDSKRRFGDHRIHLEFRTPFQPSASGQGRGNSGVYVQGRYECQVLDSFGLDGLQNECGGIYSIAEPIVNACLPPGRWQTYDIDFTAARWRGLEKVRDARMTVHLNGVLVHDGVALPHVTTAAKRKESDSPGGLYLQDHGNRVAFRNIWVVERDPDRTRKVVLLPGRPSHGYASHEHRAGCLLLAQALEASGLPIATEVHSIWPDDPSTFDDVDVIVSFADGGRGHPFLRHLGEVDELMARGVSLVCIHYAVEVPKGVPGQQFVDWLGGYFETDWSVNPWWKAEFTSLPEHPITRGVEPFAVLDEWYFHMRFRSAMEGVTPILSAVAPESTMQRPDGPHSGNPAVRRAVAAGEPQHVAWAYPRPDGGRAFGFTGAHVHWNWGHDDFRTVMLNAIAWCAHLDVPEAGVASTRPDAAALQANQDFEPGERFDHAQLQKLLESFPR